MIGDGRYSCDHYTPIYRDNPVGGICGSEGGVAFDRANVWLANVSDGAITKLKSDGTQLGTFTVRRWAIAVAFDGANIWVTNGGSQTVTKLRGQ